MKIIKCLEYENEKYYEGEHVTLNRYDEAEISGIITTISDNLPYQGIIITLDEGGLSILNLKDIEKICKSTRK